MKEGRDATFTVRKILLSAVSLAIIGYLVVLVEPRKLAVALSQISLPSILALLLLSFLLLLVSVVKWRAFLRGLGAEVSLGRLGELYLIGYFVNALLPSNVGGDVVRSYSLGRQVGQGTAFTATLLERYTGLVAMVALAFVAVWSGAIIPPTTKNIVLLMTAGIVASTVIVLSDRASRLIAALPLPAKVGRAVETVHRGIDQAWSDPWLVVWTLVLSFTFHALTVVNTAVAGWAVGWSSPSVMDLMAVVPLILLLGGLPLTPSGLGVQEGAFFFFLTRIGATPEQALGIAVILRAKSYLLGVLGAVLWFTTKGHPTTLH